MIILLFTILIIIFTCLYSYNFNNINTNKEIVITYAFLKKLILQDLNSSNYLIINILAKKRNTNYLNIKCKCFFGFLKEEINKEKTSIKNNLEKYTKRVIKYIAKCNNMSLDELYLYLEVNHPDNFSKYKSFNIFGDSQSTDIDILIQVDNVDKPLFSDQINIIEKNLSQLKYDLSKPIDYNLVEVENGNIINCKKGGLEIQNILYYTYDLHNQKFNKMVNRTIEIDLHPKSMAINKFILNYLKDFTIYNYELISKEKAKAYSQGGIELIKFTNSQWDNFCLDCNDSSFNKDIWKSLTVKYLQLLILYYGIYDKLNEKDKIDFYTKQGLYKLTNKLCLKSNTYLPDECIKNLLFRKKCYDFRLIKFLHSKYCDIIFEFYPRFKKPEINEIKIEDYKSPLSIDLTKHFFENPIKLNRQFCELWYKNFGLNLQSQFIQNCINIKLLKESFPELINKVHDEPQCSNEWKKLLNFYKCGNNKGINDISNKEYQDWEIIQARSNLLMGLMGEDICLQNLKKINNFEEEYELVTVGLLVKNKYVKNIDGCAPDGLLICKNKKEIIPIEIKTIASKPQDNRILRRELILGKKQLSNACKIINYNNQYISEEGLLIVLWIYQDNNKWKFEMHSEVMNVATVFN